MARLKVMLTVAAFENLGMRFTLTQRTFEKFAGFVTHDRSLGL
jgi:hypothetical protein